MNFQMAKESEAIIMNSLYINAINSFAGFARALCRQLPGLEGSTAIG